MARDQEEIRRLVDKYCMTQRNPSLPKFTIHAHTHTPNKWRTSPEAAKAGCYVFYDESGVLRYIGKASMGATIRSRIDVHMAHAARDPKHRFRKWPPANIDIIEVVEPFEAPSLEEYLQMNISDYNIRMSDTYVQTSQ
jgi:excinuclease UvrABC nuclease subunit